jgi:3-methyladenine DNA glycosylase Mpg
MAHDVRRLSRAGLPVDTAELARYPIRKTVVRNVGRSRIVGRIVETETYPLAIRADMLTAGKR